MDSFPFFEACHPNAIIPTRGSDLAAGYDFYAAEDFTIPPNSQVVVETGIKSHFREDTVLMLKSRSGLVFKHWVDTCAGVIDADYKNTIKVILFNRHPEKPFEGKIGDRISQGIFMALNPHYYPTESSSKPRDGGFGSTGMR